MAADPNGFPLAHWNRRSVIGWLLLPLAWLFAGVVASRRLAYRSGLKQAIRLPVPTIVIGNFTVGGAGKTPLTIGLVQALRAAGYRPGVVSCGYGGSGSGSRRVDAASDPHIDGDEPVLIARRTGVPSFVNRDRSSAALALLAAHPEVDVLVCDDGLQHLRLARDIEIAVVDRRGYGNGWLMPAGPLREHPRPVDALVRNGAPAVAAGEYAMTLTCTRLYAVHAPNESINVASLNGLRLHAVAGIGAPGRFFATVRELGLDVVEHPFPDHHAFAASDLEFADCDRILMTEKDAVKCVVFGRGDLIAVQVDAKVDVALLHVVIARLVSNRLASSRLPTPSCETPNGQPPA